MTWRNVIYDTWVSLKQNIDDPELTLSHVKYWVIISANRLMSQHIEKRDSKKFLNVFNNVLIQKELQTGYKYIELPKDIFDFDGDMGVNYISYSSTVADDNCDPMFTQVQFSRTTQASSRVLYYTEEETPTPDNPYFYLSNNKVYFLGIECVHVKGVEIGIYTNVDATECDLDSEFPFPSELLPILQKYVLDLGRFVLMIPRDMINDGNFEVQGNLPTQKLVSTNTMQQQQPQAQQQQQYQP